jgi:hypothetical protein
MSWNLGASTSWNPQGLSRPVMELIYLFKVILAAFVSKCTTNNGMLWHQWIDLVGLESRVPDRGRSSHLGNLSSRRNVLAGVHRTGLHTTEHILNGKVRKYQVKAESWWPVYLTLAAMSCARDSELETAVVGPSVFCHKVLTRSS